MIQENAYYKDDLVPTMRDKNKEMQRKFKDFDAERKALMEENAGMRQGNKTDSEQLDKMRKAHYESITKTESLENQISTLRSRFDEQLAKHESQEAAISRYNDQIQAFEVKI